MLNEDTGIQYLDRDTKKQDFIGYWNSLVIDSKFDLFLAKLNVDTSNYLVWFFRDAPLELGESIKRLLSTCIEKKCDMRPALQTAINWGLYDIALFLIEKAPALIDTLQKQDNIVVEGISYYISNLQGFYPTQSEVNKALESLNQNVQKILNQHQNLVAVFAPLTDIKTVTAASIKNFQKAFYEIYPFANFGGEVWVIGVNQDLNLLLPLVQWREDTKDIIALLRQKALKKIYRLIFHLIHLNRLKRLDLKMFLMETMYQNTSFNQKIK